MIEWLFTCPPQQLIIDTGLRMFEINFLSEDLNDFMLISVCMYFIMQLLGISNTFEFTITYCEQLVNTYTTISVLY